VGERDAGASAPVPERTAAERAPGPAAGERKTRGAASAGGPYSVHVESFPSMADAEKGAKRYRQSGEIVLIIEKEIPGKGIWYRVFLGRFPNSEEAADHAEEIKETFGLTYAMVMRVEP
jgi:cell division septation protein DedD